MIKHFNIPIFIPHAGCKHDCVFCNQKKITNNKERADILSAKKIIEDHLESILSRYEDPTIEIAFFGGSFTGIEESVQLEYLELASQYKKYIKGIRLSTRPDYIDDHILTYLKKYGVRTIELGVQSLDEKVLMIANRGHSIEDAFRAVKLIKQYDFNLGLQMMIGLPGDTEEKALHTARTIIDLKPDMVRIYPTIVIKDTELEKMYLDGVYQPLSFTEAVELSKTIYKMFLKEDIPVIRIGLQATETMAENVAGPYHPSFRQFVEASLYLDILDQFLNNKKGRTIKIYSSSKKTSNIVGQKRNNLNYLEHKYGIKIKVYTKNIEGLEIDIDDKIYYLSEEECI